MAPVDFEQLVEKYSNKQRDTPSLVLGTYLVNCRAEALCCWKSNWNNKLRYITLYSLAEISCCVKQQVTIIRIYVIGYIKRSAIGITESKVFVIIEHFVKNLHCSNKREWWISLSSPASDKFYFTKANKIELKNKMLKLPLFKVVTVKNSAWVNFFIIETFQ
jgi:hypothetical protein